MGFAKKSRKAAKAGQEQALRDQQASFALSQQMAQDYNQGFEKRNAAMIALQTRAQSWLDSYDKGTDVSKLNPALAQTLMDAANVNMRTTQVVNRMGNNALVKGDKGYQQKLSSLAQRQMFRDMGALNEQGLMTERANQTGILMDSSNFLNSDRMSAFNMQSGVFGQSNSIFNNWTSKRNMEIARGNAMNNMLMQGVMGGVSGFITAGSAGGMFGAKGLFGGPK